MELDFKTVKALSSPTRLNILREVLEKESTPTRLSDELEKSKSTVSSHLKTLTDAELLEKDKVEGRKRVIYRPTRKAEAIVEGRERKVKFSIASSAISSFAGVALLGYATILQKSFMASKSAGDTATALKSQGIERGAEAGISAMSKSMESAQNASESAAHTSDHLVNLAGMLQPESAFLYMGAGLLGIAALSLLYGLMMRKLGR